MERLDMYLLVAKLEVDEGERHEVVLLSPLIEAHQHPAGSRVTEQIPVRRMEEALVHPLDLRRENVLHPVVEGFQMVPLAPELEGRDQPVMRKHFEVVRRDLGHASAGGLDRDQVRQAHDPDVRLIGRALQVSALMNAKQLRMKGALIEHELQIRYALHGSTKFH